MPEQEQQSSGNGVPGIPKGAKFFTLTKFKGMNTQAQRMSIADEEFSWIENWIPLGDGNLRTLYGKGENIYTAPVGKTVLCMSFYNIGTTPYGIAFLDDGTAVQFRTDTGGTTTVTSTANTFYNGGSLPQSVQWGRNGIVIVSDASADCFYAWDGTTLYKPGDQAPSWLSGLSSNIVVTGNEHTTVTIDGMSSVSGIQVGMSVTGTNIPANTFVASIVSTTSITITQAATGTAAGVTLTFSWLMPKGIKGTTIEAFQNRIWTAYQDTVTFSASGNGATFATALGGGTFKSTDSFLKNSYICLKQANGYLYLFGDSSINYIGNVQTTVDATAGTITTVFNNLNTDPQVGTPWNYSVVPYGRALMIVNTSGIYAMFGGSAEKVSDNLNGLFATATLPLTGITNQPSSAVATIFGKRLFFVLLKAIDPFTGLSRRVMAAWDQKQFFVASQEIECTFISTQEVNSELTAWGTDGNSIFQMFKTPSLTLTKKYKTKLWAGSSYLLTKQHLRSYIHAYDVSNTGSSVGFTVDSEINSTSQYSISNFMDVSWTNNSGDSVSWINNFAQDVSFIAGGTEIAGINVDSQYGKLIGYSVSTQGSDIILIEQTMMCREQSFYG